MRKLVSLHYGPISWPLAGPRTLRTPAWCLRGTGEVKTRLRRLSKEIRHKLNCDRFPSWQSLTYSVCACGHTCVVVLFGPGCYYCHCRPMILRPRWCSAFVLMPQRASVHLQYHGGVCVWDRERDIYNEMDRDTHLVNMRESDYCNRRHAHPPLSQYGSHAFSSGGSDALTLSPPPPSDICSSGCSLSLSRSLSPIPPSPELSLCEWKDSWRMNEGWCVRWGGGHDRTAAALDTCKTHAHIRRASLMLLVCLSLSPSSWIVFVRNHLWMKRGFSGEWVNRSIIQQRMRVTCMRDERMKRGENQYFTIWGIMMRRSIIPLSFWVRPTGCIRWYLCVMYVLLILIPTLSNLPNLTIFGQKINTFQ